MDMGFPAERTHFFRASIKLAQPFPAPESRTRILRTRGFSDSFQNHYTHDIIIFKLFWGLQLQLSGVFRINCHYSYGFLVFVAKCSYVKEFPSGILKKILRLQLHA